MECGSGSATLCYLGVQGILNLQKSVELFFASYASYLLTECRKIPRNSRNFVKKKYAPFAEFLFRGIRISIGVVLVFSGFLAYFSISNFNNQHVNVACVRPLSLSSGRISFTALLSHILFTVRRSFFKNIF
jgi:hypothetical protein